MCLGESVRINRWAGLLISLTAFPSWASSGHALPRASASALGMTDANVALVQGPSSQFINPANLADAGSGTKWEAGALFGVIKTDLHRPAAAGATTAGDYPAKDRHPVIPYAALAQQWSEKLAIGFSVEVPHGLGVDWPDHTFDLSLGPAGTADLAQMTELRVLRFGPAIATPINPQWAVGTRIFAQYVEATEENDFSRVEGDGTSLGAQIGLRYAVGDLILGGAYTTRTRTEIKGSLRPGAATTLIEGDATADILLPARLQIGLAFRVLPNMWWEWDLDWLEWSYVDELTIRQSNGTIANAGKNERHNRNTVSLRTGIKWTRSPTLTLYAGLSHDPTPTAERDASPTSSMVRKTRVGIGATHLFASGTKLDVAYQYIRGHSRRIDETEHDNLTPSIDTNLFEGTYETASHILGLSLTTGF